MFSFFSFFAELVDKLLRFWNNPEEEDIFEVENEKKEELLQKVCLFVCREKQQKEIEGRKIANKSGIFRSQRRGSKNGSRIYRRLGPDADFGRGHIRRSQVTCKS